MCGLKARVTVWLERHLDPLVPQLLGLVHAVQELTPSRIVDCCSNGCGRRLVEHHPEAQVVQLERVALQEDHLALLWDGPPAA